MKGQHIVTCNQCGSNKVRKTETTAFLLFGAVALGWIPILGWIVAAVFIIMAIARILRKGKSFVCQECKHGFLVSKETFIEYKSYLKASE